MAFLSHINGSDIASLVQNIYFPAVQNDPLYQVMFPGNLQDDQRNDIIKWYYIGMQRAFNSRTTFYKACTDDGTAVGFAGWVLEEPTHNSVTQTKSKEETVLLQTLDVNAWQDVSRALMKERRRVLDSLENVLRKYNSSSSRLFIIRYHRVDFHVCTSGSPETRGWFHYDGAYLRRGRSTLQVSVCVGFASGCPSIFEVRL
jgi:hypothetical protein